MKFILRLVKKQTGTDDNKTYLYGIDIADKYIKFGDRVLIANWRTLKLRDINTDGHCCWRVDRHPMDNLEYEQGIQTIFDIFKDLKDHINNKYGISPVIVKTGDTNDYTTNLYWWLCDDNFSKPITSDGIDRDYNVVYNEAVKIKNYKSTKKEVVCY